MALSSSCSPSVSMAYLPSNVIADDFTTSASKKRPAKPQVKTACVSKQKEEKETSRAHHVYMLRSTVKKLILLVIVSEKQLGTGNLQLMSLYQVSRPCKRCVSSDKADSCHDIQHKKRGRPKLRAMKPHQASLSSTNSSMFTMTAPNHEQHQHQEQQQQDLAHHQSMSSTMTVSLCLQIL